MKKIIVALLIILGISCLFLLVHSSTGSTTGEVKMNNDVVAGDNGEYTLKKGTIVKVSKQYYLPQILLPSFQGYIRRFETPSPLYSQIGTGVYFSSTDATEVVPFKGKLADNAISLSLSLSYGYNLFIVLGFIIVIIALIIFIKNKPSENRD